MRGENLGNRAGTLALLLTQLFEEAHKGGGIVAHCPHVLDSQEVCFPFGVAAELQEGERQAEVEALVDAVAGRAARPEDDQRES